MTDPTLGTPPTGAPAMIGTLSPQTWPAVPRQATVGVQTWLAAEARDEGAIRVIARAEATSTETTPLAGFIASSFSPLVAEVAARCLTTAGRVPVSDGGAGGRTGIVIVSASGDVATNVSAAQAVDAGTRLGPLLFFQAVPNAVAGHVAAKWGLTGPVVCVSPAGNAMAEGEALADLLLADGDADEVLVVAAEQSTLDGQPDRAHAVLLTSKGDQP